MNVAVFPGEDGWVRQLGNTDKTTYFGVIERRFSPSLPRKNQRRKSWGAYPAIAEAPLAAAEKALMR